jgi:hypothetical protein
VRGGRELVADTERWLSRETIGQVLYRLNTPTQLERVAAPYRELLRISTPENDAGPRMVASWYARNVQIAGNVVRDAAPGSRVLVLFGQGHIPLLRELLGSTPGIELLDPLGYLPVPIQCLAAEIIEMAAADQNMRRAASADPATWDPSVDRRNTARLRAIVAEIGWPTRSRVGDQAEHQAWLLVQHADADRPFQRECLELMRREPPDEVCAKHLAYLDDRIRTADGRPQLYGTQLRKAPGGEWGPGPLEDSDRVDERRAAVDLEPLAQYVARANEPRTP